MKERIEKDEENIASQKQELSNCHSEIVKLSNGELHKLSREARSAATDRITGDEAMLKRQKHQMKRETDQILQITAEKHNMELAVAVIL